MSSLTTVYFHKNGGSVCIAQCSWLSFSCSTTVPLLLRGAAPSAAAALLHPAAVLHLVY